MPFTSGPFTPVRDTEIGVNNPALGGGNVSSVAAVIRNVSSFLLKVSGGSGNTLGQIEPFTTDSVPLDPDADQRITLLPQSLGFINLQTVVPTIYVTWFQQGEDVPGVFPYGVAGASQLQVQGLLSAGADLVGPATAQLLPAPPANSFYRLVTISAVANAAIAGVAQTVILNYVKSPASSLFVAVSGTTVAETSPDGITWTQRAMPVSDNWYAVAFGAGVFAAIAGFSSTNAATSPDGITWTLRTMPSPGAGSWTALAFGNSTFVAVNSGALLAATSPDGITWTSRATSATGTTNAAGIAFGAGVFAALLGAVATVITSPDGITWTSRVLPTADSWQGIAFGAGVFAAVSNTGGASTVAASSPDGIAWTQRVLPVASAWTEIAFGNGVFVAIDPGSTNAATSPDGIAWTHRVIPSDGNGWSTLAFANGLFCSLDYAGSQSMTSPDGITWTVHAAPNLGVNALTGALVSAQAIPNIVAFSGVAGDALVDARALHGVPIEGAISVTAGPAGNTADTEVWLFYDLVEV